MKNSGTDDLSDLSMLDLFRTELETNARVLETGLKHIEGQYSPEMIESLIRAAHSIKGAARIVDLKILVPLAGALENILSNVNQGKMLITSNDIETLVQCNNIFIGIASLNASEIHNQLKKQENIINDSCEKLTEMLSSIHIEKKTEKPALDVHQEIIHPLRRANDRIFDELPDYSILELFHIEVENHSRVLEKGLLEIENNQSPEKIEPLMRAAHSIKGAARIINLNLEVSLAHTIEDVFSKVQRGALTLSANDIDILLRSNDIFLHLTTLNTSEITGWLFTQSNKIKILTQTLIDILAGKSVEPSIETETYKVTEFPVTKFPLKKEDSFVRVLTDNLNYMIGFAGECLVQAKSSKPFSTSLLQIKNTFMILASMLENILQSPHTASFSKETHIKIDESLKRFNQLREFLNQHIENYERFSRRFEYIADKLYGQVVECRMRPFSDGVQGFPRMVRDLAKQVSKEVDFKILGRNTRVDRDILEKLEAPLTHLLHNAVDHGLETSNERIASGKPARGKLVLEARHIYGMLYIIVTDDGRGIEKEKIRRKVVELGHITEDVAANLSDSELFDFLFLPGFSTATKVSEISGRGVGLDVVSSMIHEVGGSVRIESHLGQGTTFHLHLPLTLSVLRTLLVEINGEPYALPLTRIDHVLEVIQEDLHVLEDRQFCTFDNTHIGIVKAQQVLRLPDIQKTSNRLYIAIISDRLNQYGLVVDRFLGERELVVRPLDIRLGKIPNISAGAIMEDGAPVLIMDVDDLVRSIDNLLSQYKITKVTGEKKSSLVPKKRILVVDDSLTVRQVERKLLENRGYEVVAAVDGIDGWIAAQSNTFDLVVSDIDMPRMNGIELIKRIKNDSRLKELPVMIISYKDREEDKLMGLEAGANYYLTKASFHDETLINAVIDLIGEP